MNKQRLFIGSSREALPVAKAIEETLREHLDAQAWGGDDALWQPGRQTLVNLISHLNTSDYGAFVFAKDDAVRIREDQKMIVRDNVLFELGLFMGRLGSECSFILMPEDMKDFHLPVDLDGTTTISYNSNDVLTNPHRAVAKTCQKILQAIKTANPDVGYKIIEARKEDVLTYCFKLATEAELIIYATGSRSNDKKYLNEITNRIRTLPTLEHYRVLFGPVREQNINFVNHLTDLQKIIARRQKKKIDARIHIGQYSGKMQSETFITGNEREAILILPSFTHATGLDTFLHVTRRETVKKIENFVTSLYAIARETQEET